MKNFRRVIVLLLAVLTLTACSTTPATTPSVTDPPAVNDNGVPVGHRANVLSLNGTWELYADTLENTYIYKNKDLTGDSLSGYKTTLEVKELPANAYFKVRVRAWLQEGEGTSRIGVRIGGGQWVYTDVAYYRNGQAHWMDLSLDQTALQKGENTLELTYTGSGSAMLVPENGCSVQLKGATYGKKWITTTVPQAVEKDIELSYLDEVRPDHFNGIVWYRRKFTPQALENGSWWLCFDAVDYRAEVWVNGRFLGSHEGGYTSFDFCLADVLREGENEVVVRVVDQDWNNGLTDDDIHIKETLAGFTQDTRMLNYAGIWQNVYLEARGDVFARNIFVNTLDISGKLQASATLVNPGSSDQTVTVQAAVTGGPAAEGHVTVPAHSSMEYKLPEMTVQNPKIWTADTPNLYELTFTTTAGSSADTVKQNFGIRTVSVSGTKVLVNGQAVFLTGMLHWGSYYDNYTSAVSVEQVRYELTALKEDGFNAIKYCLISPPDYVLELCDEIGMYVYIEYPNWNPVESDIFFERSYLQMMEMVIKDRRFPSVIMTDFNCEDLQFSESMDRLMKWCVETAKKVAPNRLYTDNSSNGDHRYGDFATCHPYYQMGAFENMLEGWMEKRGGQPLILGEYADISVLRDLGELKQQESADYSWYHDYYKDYDQAEIMRQAGYSEEEIDTIIAQSVGNAQEIRKYFIEASKSNGQVAGLFLTHIFESPNGWADGWFDDLYQKHFDPAVIRPAASSTAMLLDRNTVNFRAGGAAMLGACVSHYNGRDLTGAKVHYTLSDGSKTVQTGVVRDNLELKSGGYYRIGDMTIQFPASSEAVRYTLTLTLSVGSETVAQNNWNLWAYPTETLDVSDIAIYDPQNTLNLAGRYPNAEVFTTPYTKARVLVTTTVDSSVLSYLGMGGKVVFAGQGEGPIATCNNWDFDRLSFAFLGQPDHPLAQALKSDGYGGLQFQDLATQWHMDGSETARGNLIGRYGTTLGVIGSYLGEYQVGAGTLLQTTLRLGTEGYCLGGGLLTHETLNVRSGDNPLGAYLLDQMVRYLYEAK